MFIGVRGGGWNGTEHQPTTGGIQQRGFRNNAYYIKFPFRAAAHVCDNFRACEYKYL